MGVRVAIVLMLATGTALGADDTSAWVHLAEYEVSRQGEIWQAPNRVQDFRTHFETDGIRLVPRTEQTPSWEWALTLSGIGRPGAVVAVEPAQRRVDGHRIEYDRRDVVEWYVNDERGLEQGFTLAVPPPPTRGEVAIELALDGTLQPTFSADGLAIDFRNSSGAFVLRYGQLVVLDASGETLPAHMEGFAAEGKRGIRIVFDDRGAVYPVTVDPLLTAAAWSGESDQASAWYGYSVATAGDVNGDGYSDVIVGAPAYDNGQGDEGRAYVYHGSPSGLSPAAAWTAESDEANALFGWSVATAGDVNGDGYDDVLVGAYAASNAWYQEGRAYLYYGSATGLSATPGWTVEGGQDVAYLGTSVATAGDVNGDGYADVVIGAPGYSNGQPGEGRAYVYLGSSSGPTITPAWTVEPDKSNTGFGGSVATAGDVDGDGYDDVIVGASSYDNGLAFNAGAAYLYHGSASGLALVPAWSVVGNQASAQFGNSVSTAGDVNGDGYADIVVGAFESDGVSATNDGEISVHLGSTTGVSPSAAWSLRGDQSGDRCGVSVATAGDLDGDGYADIAFGCYGKDGGGHSDVGYVAVWRGSPAGLEFSIAVLGNQAAGQLGISSATAGDVNGDGFSDLVAGANLFDNGQTDEGRAFVFLGSPAKVLQADAGTPGILVGPPASDFGEALGSAGDVNGDGYDDAIVGAPSFDGGPLNIGIAYLYLGSDAGLSTTASWVTEGDAPYVYAYGHAVASAGDVNGDGYDDVIVGAPQSNDGGGWEGKVFVYHGSSSGLATTPAWTILGNRTAAQYGNAVASAGDVNGDGYADILVGGLGQALLYLGSASGLASLPTWSWDSNSADGFGQTLSTAGDINGDGYADVIVGAHRGTNGDFEEGLAYVFTGSADGLSGLPAWVSEGNQTSAWFGFGVGGAGDVNGDGFSDVIVSAPGYDSPPPSDLGRLFLYLGSPGGLAATPSWTTESESGSNGFIGFVAGIGDMDGDGYSDIVANGPNGWLSLVAYSGSVVGLPMSANVQFVNGYDPMGIWHVAPAGDLNGDGFADLLRGAPAAGTVDAYYGNAGHNAVRVPRQFNTDGTTRLALGGKSDSESAFHVSVQGRTAAGRGKVSAVFEAKPLGVPFDGNGWTVSPIVDTGTPGAGGSVVSFDETVSGLTEGASYRWRVRTVSPDPFFPGSPWISIPGNNVTEKKLRTAGCVDADGDGYGAHGDVSCASAVPDCSDSATAWWAVPGETRNLRFVSKSVLTWDAPAEPGAIPSELFFDTLMSSDAADFSSPVCVESDDATDTTATDNGVPPAGRTYFYLIRTQNACPDGGQGSLGTGSGGAERLGADCS